jgi:hypothetical protein
MLSPSVTHLPGENPLPPQNPLFVPRSFEILRANSTTVRLHYPSTNPLESQAEDIRFIRSPSSNLYLQSSIVDRASSSMCLFGILVGLLQIALQDRDSLLPYQFRKRE